jgi:hypothetical protein
MVGFVRALRLLDGVQHLAELDAFDPGLFIAALSEAPPSASANPGDVGGEQGGMPGLFDQIDRFAQKAMRIRLNHVSGAVPPKLATLFATTIVAYEDDPALLRARVFSMLGRVDRPSATALTDQICAAADKVLAVRASLRRGVAEMVKRLAADQSPATRQPPKDPSQPEGAPDDDPTSKRFSLVETD